MSRSVVAVLAERNTGHYHFDPVLRSANTGYTLPPSILRPQNGVPPGGFCYQNAENPHPGQNISVVARISGA
ncbi:hypothetical protein Lsha_0961 [Legionella shakespearei DSM 23087]|uniref:Uncharacterized protein n=1 Tax=Legionella shakespearei DSM 23087 TaxID=1122169 RepID=A0A0W0Z0L5_9GAMM|nr:hypothetical protein Lsha_0961 [Legionella shakespearei DSM 23087]